MSLFSKIVGFFSGSDANTSVQTKTSPHSSPSEINLQNMRKSEILRKIEILQESVELVNTSNDLTVVLRRFAIVCNHLKELSGYSDMDFSIAGVHFDEPPQRILSSTLQKRIPVINQAIDRNITHNLDKLSTPNGKAEKLNMLYNKFLNLSELAPENIDHLKAFVVETMSQLSADYGRSFILIDQKLHEQTIINASNNGESTITTSPDKEITDFYSLSNVIQQGGDIHTRIAACEQSFKFLPDFVKNCLELDGDLPPVIPCRDYAPNLYMKIGQWDKAEKAIRYCIGIGAYYPATEGEQALENFQNYKQTAFKIIAFLRDHPGFLQKNIYKAVGIADSEKSDAKHFLRYSMLLRKESAGKTNMLYIME